MPIKCVIFDFDGVLRIWEFEESKFEIMYGISIDKIREVAFAPERLYPAVKGLVTNEHWRAEVREALKTEFDHDRVDVAMDDWDSRMGVLVPEAIAVAEECKKVVPIALFSNATTRLPEELEFHGLSNFFDHVINASESGYMKPEPEIYGYALDRIGFRPEEVFFTDDGLAQVEAAVELGWNAHHFKSASGLRNALVEAGVLADI